ncbi:hypothetical protein BH18ACT16_BH18ACT16_05810 [soil metagenome]
MFLNGSLENFSVADILQLLSFSKQTGALHVTGEITGVLYLDDVEVYFATREDAGHLEDTVAAAGIPREDWNAALESAGHNHAAGRALAERGVAADLIGYVVHHIVSDSTFELMRMPRSGGAFDFRVGEQHPVGPAHTLRVDELVAEVRDRLAEWEAISEFISSPSDLVSAPSALTDDSVELTVSREQWALLVATIRNERATVSELARATDRSEAEVVGALHPLISSGLMEVEPHAEAMAAEPSSVLEADSDPLAREMFEEALGSFGSPPVLDSSDEELALSWEPLEPQLPGGPPSDQAEMDMFEPIGSELDEWRHEGDSLSDPLEDRDDKEQEQVGDLEAESSESPLWDLDRAGTDLEETQTVEEQEEESPLSPAETIDVGPSGAENAGIRTMALQELRDLAGSASVQPATGARSTNSRKPAETSDDPPPAQPKVRALKRIIAAVRGL